MMIPPTSGSFPPLDHPNWTPQLPCALPSSPYLMPSLPPSGGYNYAASDIANALNECAGTVCDGREGVPDFRLLPDATQKRAFVRAYLEALNERAPTAEAVEAMVSEVELFEDLAHLRWGLWAVVQAQEEGCEGWPYMTYAVEKIRWATRCRHVAE